MKKVWKFLSITVAFILLVVIAVFSFSDTLSIPDVYATFWSITPPILAIALALITKEVYSSLFIGIVFGALLYSNFNFEKTVNAIFYSDGGLITKLSDTHNIGIIIFLVTLGILVNVINKVGGSVAFGEWTSKKIKSRKGTQLITLLLGMLIFIDDYFNCLTLGSVMRPVTDKHRISRAKLAYIIDSTAAPVCILAPISSWAVAVASSIPKNMDLNGFMVFLQTIPFNFYAILTLLMVVFSVLLNVNIGPMRKHEYNAVVHNDLFTTDDGNKKEYEEVTEETKGKVIDLVLPIVVLIFSCALGMLYTGGFFGGASFVSAFANTVSDVGLVIGSFMALIFTFVFYLARRTITFKDFMECVPKGFMSMVPVILILVFAWSLSGITSMLGSMEYVASLVANFMEYVKIILPALLCLVGFGLAFATGTSWGTFSMLIPIVCGVFPADSIFLVIAISACVGGAVAGDHCSPISDTTIMASAGAKCNHINHVVTQMPYVLTVVAISVVGYILAALIQNPYIVLAIVIAILIAVLFAVKFWQNKKGVESIKEETD